MPSAFQFDHAVVWVTDVDRAATDYAALGFTVTPGGEHEGGATRNALIAFADGSYLELLTLSRPWQRRLLPWQRRLGLLGRALDRRTGLERRFLRRMAGREGLIDFALRPDGMEGGLGHARAAGLEVEGPLPGRRVQPDGEEVAWQLGIPRAPEVPFLCADVTPHERRVPAGAAREHSNGVLGVARIVVAVENLEASSARYRALLGREPHTAVETPLAGSRGRMFPLDGAELVLMAPAGVSPALRRHLREHGEGPFALQLRCTSELPTRQLDPVRCHGARLELCPA